MSMPVRIIAMLNQKGGVGKTTTTVNLGAAIAESGRRVCLIDLDPQAHLTLHLGIDPASDEAGQSIYDLMTDPDSTAASARFTARENLDILTAETDLAAVETELATHPDRQRILKRKFEPILRDYDYVFIDCPPSLGLLTLNALSLAKEVFVPMQAHFLALQGVGKLLETVGLVCQSVNPSLRVTGIILCMHEGQTTLAREIVADLDSFFENARHQDVPWKSCRVLRPAIRRNIKLAEAPSFGKTIFDYEPWCPGALDYRKLAERVTADWEAVLARRADVAVPQSENAQADRDADAKPQATEQNEARDPGAKPQEATGEIAPEVIVMPQSSEADGQQPQQRQS
jgi:chromosome partitioning protein